VDHLEENEHLMPTIEANDQTLYYEDSGEGEPLLCVMGLAADTLAWALQVNDFTERHRMVFFDNRDVGQSSRAEGPYEVADMAQDALALADGLGLDAFHLIGVSMGGAIAQEMALAAPDRIKTLTLVVTFAALGHYAEVRAQVWEAQVARSPHDEHIDDLMLLTLSEEFFENREMVEYVRNMMLANPHPQEPEAFARQLRASTRHDARDRLGSLDGMPVHVIGAGHDILVPVWKSEEVRDLIPGSNYSVMEGAPHGVQLERAAEFNKLVLDFVAEHAAAPAVRD
jgi:3-oxoadipate enol-lactonase